MLDGEIRLPPWSWFIVPTLVFSLFPTIATVLLALGSFDDPLMFLHCLRAFLLYGILPIAISLAGGGIAYRTFKDKPLNETLGGFAGALVGVFIGVLWYAIYLQYETMGWLKPPDAPYSRYSNSDAPPAAADAVGQLLLAPFVILYVMGYVVVGKKLARHVTAEAANSTKLVDVETKPEDAPL